MGIAKESGHGRSRVRVAVPGAAPLGVGRIQCAGVAVRDAFPVSEGHTLVVPHRLVPDLWSLSPVERHGLWDLVDVVVERLRSILDPAPDGFTIGVNDGAAAGQTVAHVHVHVIPRRQGDVPDPRGGVRHVLPGKGNYLLDPAPAETIPAPPAVFDESASPAAGVGPADRGPAGRHLQAGAAAGPGRCVRPPWGHRPRTGVDPGP